MAEKHLAVMPIRGEARQILAVYDASVDGGEHTPVAMVAVLDGRCSVVQEEGRVVIRLATP